MLRPLILTASTLASLAAGSFIAEGRGTTSPVVARAVGAAAHSQLDAHDALNDAVAAAVIGSVSRQFDSSDVTVKLDDVRIAPASIQDREVTGQGRLRLDGDPQWIPFRFAALYDTASTEVTYPRLKLGASGVSAADATLARSLAVKVEAALRAEFSGQGVSWTPGPATVAGDGRYLRVAGTGVADFGSDGEAPAHVEGLYDRRDARWVRVNYELGSGEPLRDAPAVASL